MKRYLLVVTGLLIFAITAVVLVFLLINFAL